MERFVVCTLRLVVLRPGRFRGCAQLMMWCVVMRGALTEVLGKATSTCHGQEGAGIGEQAYCVCFEGSGQHVAELHA